MLEIIVNHNLIDIKPDIQIHLTIENPFMLEDRIPLPYSFGFEIPLTSKNLVLFEFPNRIASYKEINSNKLYSCTIRFNSLNLAHGQIKITSVSENMNAQFLGFDVDEELKKKMYEYEIGTETFSGNFNTYDFNDSSNFAYQYKNWATNAAQGLDDKLVAAPLAFKQSGNLISMKTTDDYNSGTYPFHYSSVFYQRNTYLHGGYITPHIHQDYLGINVFNPVNQNFITSGSSSENVTLSHANIFPQFRIGWLIERFFTNGLLSNPFSEGNLINLVLPTFYFPKWVRRSYRLIPYSPTQATPPLTSNLKWKDSEGDEIPPQQENWPNVYAKYDEQPFINYADFLPDVPVNEFLKQILNTFSFHLTLTKGKFGIKSSKNIISSLVKYNWTSKIIGNPEITTVPGKAYKHGYANKQYASIQNANNISELNTLYDLSSIELDPTEEEDDVRIYFVKESNCYYQITGILSKLGRSGGTNPASEDEILLTIENLGEKPPLIEPTEKESYNAEVSIVKLNLISTPHFITLDRISPGYPDTYFYKTPLIEGHRKIRPQEVSLLYYEGNKPIDQEISGSVPTYPSVTNKSDTFSLDWEGEHGLLENFHLEFKNWVEKDKLKISATILLNPIDIQKLDITDKVHVNGRNFYIEKIQITLKLNQIEPALVDFIEV